MALRLTSTLTPLDAPVEDDRSLVARLSADAESALAGGDLAAFSACVARTGELEDPQRTYALALQLLELGLTRARVTDDQRRCAST